jgi:hypothetical protein
MGIGAFREEINQNFEILGESGQEWGPFRKGVHYKRFLLFKKIN